MYLIRCSFLGLGDWLRSRALHPFHIGADPSTHIFIEVSRGRLGMREPAGDCHAPTDSRAGSRKVSELAAVTSGNKQAKRRRCGGLIGLGQLSKECVFLQFFSRSCSSFLTPSWFSWETAAGTAEQNRQRTFVGVRDVHELRDPSGPGWTMHEEWRPISVGPLSRINYRCHDQKKIRRYSGAGTATKGTEARFPAVQGECRRAAWYLFQCGQAGSSSAGLLQDRHWVLDDWVMLDKGRSQTHLACHLHFSGIRPPILQLLFSEFQDGFPDELPGNTSYLTMLSFIIELILETLLERGYHQFASETRKGEQDISKIAFAHGYGHYEFLSKEEHEEHFAYVLQDFTIGENYMQFSKCEFWLSKVHFLVKLFQQKILYGFRRRLLWLSPNGQDRVCDEVRSFLGIAVITAVSLRVSPISLTLTKLCRKVRQFVWNEERGKRALKELKKQFGFSLFYYHLVSGGDFRFTVMLLRRVLGGCTHARLARANVCVELLPHDNLKPLERRWLELLKDYDTNIQYHPGKANVVADALSRKSGMIAGIKVEEGIIRDLERLDIELCVRGQSGFWASLRVEPNLISRYKGQLRRMTEYKQLCFDEDATHGSSRNILVEWYESDVATFVSKCLICQQVKIEHQRASGLLQPLEIPVWKWDEISMDFVTGLPRTQRKHDAIWVVVDRLTKSSENFLLSKAWGTRLKFSTAFHPETDGQSERTIQTLEDMLRSCALEWAGNWDDYICLVEFAYNNSWHASIKCAPFEMLYGRKCRALFVGIRCVKYSEGTGDD
ncbi:retrotransposon protein, putative, ty3-gypsy subclass [Tanacetum coccineum]